MEPYKFDMNDTLRVIASGKLGVVVGRIHATPRYAGEKFDYRPQYRLSFGTTEMWYSEEELQVL